jgi:uncharacterized membrane protein
MFTPPGYRKRLLADLERWTETGLISRDAADAITEEYKTDSSRAILTVLAFVFAILAAFAEHRRSCGPSRIERLSRRSG